MLSTAVVSVFSWQGMTELTDKVKREHETTKKPHIYFKHFNDSKNIKVWDQYPYTGLF